MKSVNAKTKDLKAINQFVRESVNSQPVIIRNAAVVHGLGAGMTHGEIVVEGDVGDYLGVLNAGATIRVTQNAGRYVADNMTAGKIIIQGSTAYGAGQYCYGGTVIIHGDAGDFTATMNKGATIIVEGSVGDEVGTYMLKGDVVILGNAGDNLANYLIRGTVYIGGEWKSLGHNTRLELLNDEDIARLRTLFELHGIRAVPQGFKKIVAASEKPFYN